MEWNDIEIFFGSRAPSLKMQLEAQNCRFLNSKIGKELQNNYDSYVNLTNDELLTRMDAKRAEFRLCKKIANNIVRLDAKQIAEIRNS